MNFADSWSSSVFDSESLKVYLQVLLFLGFLEFILGRIFLHVAQLSDILLPFTLIVMNFEAVIEVPILISFIYIFWKNKSSYLVRVLSGLTSFLLVVTILLYSFLLVGIQTSEVLWLCFLFVALATIFAASAKGVFAEIKRRNPSNSTFIVFLVLTNLTYLCLYVYFSSFNLSTYFGIEVPEPTAFFRLAQSLILFDALVLFFYALLVPCENFRFDRKLLFKVVLLPSTVVALLLIASVAMPTGSRFDMTEIIALVLSMWGFAVPQPQIFLYVIVFWFFLTAALLLREKGQRAKNNIHVQEFIAALLLFFAGFLNTSPYLLMGVIAVILFSNKVA